MPSTGTITLNPRSAAAPAVCSTEVCACVPMATIVLMPLSLRIFSRSLAMNLSGPNGGQHRLSRRRGKLRENVGGDRPRYCDAVDDESALAARLRHQVEDFCYGARAARPALVSAGLLGEIHDQQRGLIRNDRCRFERRRCGKFGRGPLVDDRLPVRGGTYSCKETRDGGHAHGNLACAFHP